MSRQPRWLPLLAVLAVTAIVVAACSGATPSTSPGASGGAASPSAAPSTAASSEPFTATAYPESGEAPCGQAEPPDAQHAAYGGNFKKITAKDARTVVFELCSPDVAFLSKIAFSSFAINDTKWLESKIDPSKAENQAIVSEVNGTGPFKLKAWNRGSDITMEANPDYWGEKAKAQTLVFRWSAEASQRLVELQSGTVDGIDNINPSDFDTVKNDPNLQLKPREGLNVFYVGFNNTKAPFDNEKVRQAIAQGIDRQRIVDQFYPAGSEVATHFTPCAIPNGCAGDAWYEFDAAKAKSLLGEAGFPNGFKTTIHLRDVVRGYLPEPVKVAQDIQAQLKTNLNIDATIDVQESTTYIDNADAGKLDGIHLLGWGADYPDMTNFLDYHFGAGASKQFGNKFDDITAALKEGAAGANDDARKPAYEKANNAIKQHVPMIPIAHGGSGMAYKADVQNAHASPLTSEYFAVMTPGNRSQFVFMQNGEPGGLYCADESDGEALRVCEQMLESLYHYEIGGTAAQPALAEKCEPNAELTTWTCTLREGVKFHDGATLDANDVVLSYAVQWDAAHPLHKGRDNSFSYFPGLFGGFLNPPPPAPTPHQGRPTERDPSVIRYIVRRLLFSIPVFIGIVVLVFVLARLLPGDPCRAAFGEKATPQICDDFNRRYGLDKPIPTQFAIYVEALAKGDLGSSIRFGRPVADLLVERLPMTFELTVAALLFATVFGIVLGLVSAVRRNSPVDVGTMMIANLGVSTPVFVLGLILAFLFAVVLRDTALALPPSGRISPGVTIVPLAQAWGLEGLQGPLRLLLDFVSNMYVLNTLLRGDWGGLADVIRHLILPAIAVGTIPLAIIARMTRSALLEVLGLDFIRTARAKGLRERLVVVRHGMRNAMLPVVTVIGLSIGGFLSGAVLTETIFNLTGIGKTLFESIQGRDYIVIQGVTLVVAVAYLVINLIVDISYAFLDPRIRLS